MVQGEETKEKYYSFEDKIDVIDDIIKKKRHKWQLTSISDMDFDDVSQIVRVHIYNKWSQWDQTRPLENWINTIINNQIVNQVRNTYGKLAPPCNSCKFNHGNELCGWTTSGKKDSECPILCKWKRLKESRYNLRLADSIDVVNAENECPQLSTSSLDFDIVKSAEKFHEKMKEVMPGKYWKVYKFLYIEGKTESEVAEIMGFTTEESSRKFTGYKQLVFIKNKIKEYSQKVLSNNDIIYNLD